MAGTGPIGPATVETTVDYRAYPPHHCTGAETFFAAVVRQTAGQSVESVYKQRRAVVYTSPAGEPIALQKSYEAKTIVTLEPIAVNELVFPAGTIMGVDSMTLTHEGEYIPVADEALQVRTLRTEDVPFKLTPTRLSAWAYSDPLDRALFAAYAYSAYDDGEREFRYNRRRGDLLTALSIDDFRETAHQIMELCSADTSMAATR
jgi:hypothetical protein